MSNLSGNVNNKAEANRRARSAKFSNGKMNELVIPPKPSGNITTKSANINGKSFNIRITDKESALGINDNKVFKVTKNGITLYVNVKNGVRSTNHNELPSKSTLIHINGNNTLLPSSKTSIDPQSSSAIVAPVPDPSVPVPDPSVPIPAPDPSATVPASAGGGRRRKHKKTSKRTKKSKGRTRRQRK